MTKVLLVDDDALVRMFLRQIIPWDAEDYEVVGDARDGEEALSIASQTDPDMVIADVSMPVMDGVELVRHMRGQGYTGGIIMLSCHDDFDYVKNAMKLGADEYLLKNHLTPDSLRQTLMSVREKRRISGSPPGSDKLLQKGQRSLRRELFEGLLTGITFDQNEMDLLREAGITGLCRVCTAIMVRLPTDAEVRVPNFLELCYQLETGANSKNLWSARAGSRGCTFLLDLSGEVSSRIQRERVQTLYERIENGVLGYLQVRAAIGASGVCSGEHAVATALRQAEQALFPSFYQLQPHIYGTPEAVLTTGLPEAAVDFANRLPSLLTGREEVLRNEYFKALSAFREAATMPGEVLRWLKNCDLAAGISRSAKFYGDLDAFEKYKGCIGAFVEKAKDMAMESLPKQLSAPVAAAVTYLRQNFRKPLTLSDAAAQAGFHPSYFSSVFKQEMGIGFAEYLIDLRLEAVCSALTKSNNTIKKIAEDAGFVDYQHFCKTFKKHIGISPAAFRKQNKTINS